MATSCGWVVRDARPVVDKFEEHLLAMELDSCLDYMRLGTLSTTEAKVSLLDFRDMLTAEELIEKSLTRSYSSNAPNGEDQYEVVYTYTYPSYTLVITYHLSDRDGPIEITHIARKVEGEIPVKEMPNGQAPA